MTFASFYLPGILQSSTLLIMRACYSRSHLSNLSIILLLAKQIPVVIERVSLFSVCCVSPLSIRPSVVSARRVQVLQSFQCTIVGTRLYCYGQFRIDLFPSLSGVAQGVIGFSEAV